MLTAAVATRINTLKIKEKKNCKKKKLRQQTCLLLHSKEKKKIYLFTRNIMYVKTKAKKEEEKNR